MKVFITGGSSAIGHSLISKLLDHGYEIYALSGTDGQANEMASIGAIPTFGDILVRESLREAMVGADVVIHTEEWNIMGSKDWMRAEAINISGTRNVLSLAYDLNLPKIIYCSSVAVYGDTRGDFVDESFFQGGPFVDEYHRTKWLAHFKVAKHLIDKGAPITILAPGAVYGPGATGLINELMMLFYHGRLPILPGPDFTVSYVHVDDVAEGFLLAVEKGAIGEEYILAGPAVPLGEMVDFWEQLTGRSGPLVRIPSRLVTRISPVVSMLGTVLPLPTILTRNVLRQLTTTSMVRSDKARHELGWRTRSLQEGMADTFRWISGKVPSEPALARQERKMAGLALLLAAVIGGLWFFGRKRD